MSVRTSLPGSAITALARARHQPATGGGVSRRHLLRASLGVGVGLWLAEVAGGLLAALWPSSALARSSTEIGTLDDLAARNPGLPIREGFPAYVPEARAFVVLVNPRQGFQPGHDDTGTGAHVNVIALSQVCPHLGCRPNPCLEDFWLRCPCHQSRYDRLGIKVAGAQYGPAERGMDRHPVTVDRRGSVTIDTTRIVLGPLPVALGQPGVIPPRVPNGCA
ncbi:MAG TPA: Rieske 2Fe-2S domain-containing protein [Candidatus Limnocylindrales bacterium]|nr:Rieske 2Fe-2S domain-containing protein [Candidatus Limnocylindrales bacterium]